LVAAYNLARWFAGNRSEAESVVQEAYLRAYRYFDDFQGSSMRLWLLTIVRNCLATWVRQGRTRRTSYVAERPMEDAGAPHQPLWSRPARNPEERLLHGADRDRLNAIMQTLTAKHREVLLVQEVEELSNGEIAMVTRVPLGTVMSCLSRARATLGQRWLAKDVETNLAPM
jgi:RNA polymerase sigma factor (sigma-70 family)